MKFHLGDRIVMKERYCGAEEGMIGTVVFVPGEMNDAWEDRYGVDFDNEIYSLNGSTGHTCSTHINPKGYARKFHGHWIIEGLMDFDQTGDIEIDESVSFYN